jgi:hypothetical protein
MDDDARRKRIETIAKWGAAFVGAVVIAPFVFLAIQGIVGLVIAFIIGVLVINFAPVFGTWVANKRLQMLKAVVEANPIETMQNLYRDKSGELQHADENIRDFEMEIGNYDDQLEGFKRDYPTDADSYQTVSDKMHEALVGMKREQSQARRDLAAFDKQITKAQAIYKMALAAQKVLVLSKSAESQVFAKIKEQVAFDSVRSQLNRSFASLNLALERRKDAQPVLPPAAEDTAPLPRSALAKERR